MLWSMQDGLATLIALGAAAILLRRVLGFATSTSDSPCGHCSGSPVKPAQASGSNGSTPAVFPLTLVRPTNAAPRSTSAAASGHVPGRSRHV